MTDLKDVARRAIACLDLTNLNDDCDEEAIENLCRRAATPHGSVAAVCVWPRFVSQSKTLLFRQSIRVATVVAFPGGDDEAGDVIDMTEAAIDDGADEIDMVIPYKSLMEGQESRVISRVERVKRAAGAAPVKAILETGILGTPELILQASELAIKGGADFIKTSTGKVARNATLPAARIMLGAIRDAERAVGFKPAGGVRSTEDAGHYLSLADEIMGDDWATPETFRFGASGVLDALLATLDGESEPAAKDGY